MTQQQQPKITQKLVMLPSSSLQNRTKKSQAHTSKSSLSDSHLTWNYCVLLYPFTSLHQWLIKSSVFSCLLRVHLGKFFGDLEGYLHLSPTKLLAARGMDSTSFQQYTTEREGIKITFQVLKLPIDRPHNSNKDTYVCRNQHPAVKSCSKVPL